MKYNLQDPKLSKREMEVLKLEARGVVRKEIAFMLGIKFKTADIYSQRIRKKLSAATGCHIGSLVEVAHYALQQGWVRNIFDNQQYLP